MLRDTPGRSWFGLAITVLAAFHTSPPVRALGRLGHRVISRLAENRLTPWAKAAIAGLLEPGESLADASLWADENGRRLPKTAPWHYVDVPLDEPKYDSKFSGDVSSKGGVVDKINEFRKVIADRSKSVEDSRFALRFLIHCIEDLHQPCHVGDNPDKGGNQTQVRWFDRGSNKHRVWDSGIIERAGTTEDFWLAHLAEFETEQNRRIGWAAPSRTGPQSRCWRLVRLTRTRRRARGLSQGPNSAMSIRPRTCRSRGSGLRKRGCGWPGCSMRRFRTIDSQAKPRCRCSPIGFTRYEY